VERFQSLAKPEIYPGNLTGKYTKEEDQLDYVKSVLECKN